MIKEFKEISKIEIGHREEMNALPIIDQVCTYAKVVILLCKVALFIPFIGSKAKENIVKAMTFFQTICPQNV